MSEREDYPAGVPCFVTCLVGDLETTLEFYTAVFGWSYLHAPAHGFTIALHRGLQVAGFGPAADAGPDVACAWITAVRVEDAAGFARSALSAGATVLAEDLDQSPAGRLSVIADPTGAVITVWQAGERRGAQAVNEPGAWAMSTLYTPDLSAAAEFYASVFGWQTQDFGPMQLFRLPGHVGGEPQQPVPRDVVAAMAPTRSADEAAHWAVDFWVADAEAAVAAAVATGGSVVQPVAEDGMFRRAVLTDPGGAAFGISQLLLRH